MSHDLNTFIRYCRRQATTSPDPLWTALADEAERFRDHGLDHVPTRSTVSDNDQPLDFEPEGAA